MLSLQRKLLTRAVHMGVRSICTTSILNKTYYDALGLSRDATQAEIKQAYFELSKLYHPDRISATDENLFKFREISDAYEVLGNEQSRKLYDRGLLGDLGQKYDEADDITDPIIKFYKQRQDLSKSITQLTEDPDAWSKTYFRDSKGKKVRASHMYMSEDYKYVENREGVGFLFIVCFLSGLFLWSNFEGTTAEKLWCEVFGC